MVDTERLKALMADAHRVLASEAAVGLERRELQFLLRRELGVPLDVSLGILARYEMAKRNAEKPGNVIKLPDVTFPMPNDYKPTPHEIAVWGFAQVYMDYTLETHDLNLFISAQEGLGNTYDQTNKLLRWMQENPDGVADFVEWGWAVEKGGMPDVQVFRERAKEGGLMRFPKES